MNIESLNHPVEPASLTVKGSCASSGRAASRRASPLRRGRPVMRVLRDLRCVELSRTGQRRGAIEHYYQALGHETAGQFEAAINHYRQFLRLQPRSRYAERAQENIRVLEARMRGKGKRGEAAAPDDESPWMVPARPKSKARAGAKRGETP